MAKILRGLENTRRVGNQDVLLIRPQEAVAGVQALAQAYADYYAALADSNRAQFRLYRVLGHPAQMILGPGAACFREPDGAIAPTSLGDKGLKMVPPPAKKP
jgi:hypothetical protein